MIPKVIHYCWFGGSEIPHELQTYIDGWREFYPNYEFMCWNEKTFNLDDSNDFVREAYAVKKFAFVADYVRMWAVYNYGGLYMDTDMKLLRSLDEFMSNRFFSAIEYHPDNVRIMNVADRLTPEGYKKNKADIIPDICIQSNIFAAEISHPFIKDCLDYYEDKHFVLPDGSYYNKIIVPIIMALEAEKYNFRYVNEYQVLDHDMLILPCNYFTPAFLQKDDTYAVHMVKNSWNDFTLKQRLYSRIAKIKWIKRLYDSMEQIPIFRYLFDFIQKGTWLKDRYNN